MYLFNTWQVCYRHDIEDVHKKINAEKMILTNLQHFELSKFSTNAYSE